MSDSAERGDHPYVNPHDPTLCQVGCLPTPVSDAETRAVKQRREFVKAGGNRDRTAYPSFTGLAISGGGIRSASFGLGALQALQAHSGIEGIDYLSTVSGGGYIGCSLTAATQKSPRQKTENTFPFINSGDYDDTDAVRHIRDYSNYLVPSGALDVVTALGLIGRGLVANVILIAPILLFFVFMTLLFHGTAASLDKPDFLTRPIVRIIPLLSSLHGFWLTAILVVGNLLFLMVWAFFTSVNLGPSSTLRGGWVGISKILFIVTLVTALFELQPFVLWLLYENVITAKTPESTSQAAGLHGFILALGLRVSVLWSQIPSYIAALGAFFASMGTLFAFLAKFLSEAIAAAKRATGWLALVKKISAMAALWIAAFVVPVALWLCYLLLTLAGLDSDGMKIAYFAALAVSTPLAFFINPNRTSLFRLYRDRLSKAFLFDPNGRPESREKTRFRDLKERKLKLNEIDTDLCPYPIINAALNIEGSRYANKRGRNADFFAFTPEYAGSDATGYIGTRQLLEKEQTLDLGTAMAISGAAISADMGAVTIKPLAFTLAFLNVRLGYWLRNPYSFYQSPAFLSRLTDKSSFLLFKEMFSLITEKSPTVYLTDGGHIENLGIYSLLKRRCKVIIAIDAEADPLMSFSSFLTLERYARIDLGVIIELPWRAIQDCTLAINKAFDRADEDGSAIPSSPGPHCAAAEIQYGPKEKGILLYVKASLSGDEDDYILDYKRRYREFPHESTSDQFFGEEQLEVYRALGFHIMKGLLAWDSPFAVEPRTNESGDQARQRIRDEIVTALRGTCRAG
ncbi:MAG TPA: patatin-like phospholipase family protein [Methylocella sp.]|nr:patatin-like phospholipase family protein [Methylocella sp.]